MDEKIILNRNDKILDRRKAIEEIIQSSPIENQLMLMDILKKQYNIDTNQSVISRDLHEMKVGKIKYKDTLIYDLKNLDAKKEILRLSILDINHNEALIVVSVIPGLAAFVGDFLDLNKDQISILGTIAGENTVFITPISISNINDSYKKICKYLYFVKNN